MGEDTYLLSDQSESIVVGGIRSYQMQYQLTLAYRGCLIVTIVTLIDTITKLRGGNRLDFRCAHKHSVICKKENKLQTHKSRTTPAVYIYI